MKWESKGRKKTYSIKRFCNSFKYALQGIKSAYKTEQNLLFHTVVAILVIALGIVIKLSFLELHPLAKTAKDVASGAVLFSAFIAIIVGCLIYIPKLIEFIKLLTD